MPPILPQHLDESRVLQLVVLDCNSRPARAGSLHWPASVVLNAAFGEPPSDEHSLAAPPLMHRYPEGDYDCCPWPLRDAAMHYDWVVSECYDARETGMIPDDAIVLLPDGTRVEF